MTKTDIGIYRGLKSKFDPNVHIGFFITTDTNELLIGNLSLGIKIKEYTILNGILTLTFNSGESIDITIPEASDTEKGLLSAEDKVKLDSITSINTNLESHINDKSNPHQVTKEQVGLNEVTNDAQVKRSEMGAINGVATLDGSGLVPSSLLPSYVDDVLEFGSLTSFPETGETGKIYLSLDTNYVYRWSGSEYIQVSSSLDKNIIVKEVANVDEIIEFAAKSEIAGSKDISIIKFIYPANDGSSASGLIFLYRGVAGKVLQVFVYNCSTWIREITGVTGIAGASTNAYPLERTHIQKAKLNGTTLVLTDYDNNTVASVDLSSLASNISSDIEDIKDIIYNNLTVSVTNTSFPSGIAPYDTSNKLRACVLSVDASVLNKTINPDSTLINGSDLTYFYFTSSDLSYTVKVTYKNITKTVDGILYVRRYTYYGTSDADTPDTIENLNNIQNKLTLNANGTYTFTIDNESEDGEYIYFEIPTNVTFNVNGVKCNGFSVPMTTVDSIDTNYNIYRTTNKLVNGDYTLIIS